VNNLFKSIYISLYITFLAIASVQSGLGMTDHGLMSVWSGIAIAIWPALLFFVRLFVMDVPRTSVSLNVLIALSLAGLVVALVLARTSADFILAIIYTVGLGIVGQLLYIFWYSKLERGENGLLAVGQKLPEFDLSDLNGKTISSSEFVGQPSLLMFYRGNWCPLCMAQIKEISAQYQALESKGVQVILVSPQPHENTQSLANKFEVPFRFLVDKNNVAARILGIDSKNGTPKGMELLGYDSETVLPTVLITNAQGDIIFADLTDNYRIRPEPETFIKVFQQHGIGTV